MAGLTQQTLPEMQAKSIEASLDQERQKLRSLEASLKTEETAKMQVQLTQLAEEVDSLQKETGDVTRK